MAGKGGSGASDNDVPSKNIFGAVATFVGKVSPIVTFLITLGALLSGFYVWITADLVKKGDIRNILVEVLDNLEKDVVSDHCNTLNEAKKTNNDQEASKARKVAGEYLGHWRRLNDQRMALTGKQEDESKICNDFPLR
jgi:hypothetical protein